MPKQEQIIEMFDQIAPSYDRANRILSFGIDIIWRQKACERVLRCFKDQKLHIVDVACGTGDMIAFWQEKAKAYKKNIAQIQGIDPSEAMLERAQKKFPTIEFIKARADELGLKDKSVDIISISYGLRNVVQREQALKEFARVLKNGGILLILEFVQRQKGGFIAYIRDFYLQHLLPLLGKIISQNKKAYEYLPNSIEEFLSKEELIEELKQTGFEMMYYELSLGISSMFVAQKKA